MKPTLATILIATFAIAACSRSNTEMESSPQAVINSARASEAATTTQYPPLDGNAKDGAVFEYY